MSNRPTRTRARIRAIVVAVLVLAFVIPWTYAHIAYSWEWKEKAEGDACTGKYYLTPYDKQRSLELGTISDGRTILVGISGEVSMGRQLGSFGLSAFDDNDHSGFLGGARDLHRGDSITVEGSAPSPSRKPTQTSSGSPPTEEQQHSALTQTPHSCSVTSHNKLLDNSNHHRAALAINPPTVETRGGDPPGSPPLSRSRRR